MSDQGWNCLGCGAALTLDNFGNDIIQDCGGLPQSDLFGRSIESHRVGNCHDCWRVLDLVNGQLAQVICMPVGLLSSKSSEQQTLLDEG